MRPVIAALALVAGVAASPPAAAGTAAAATTPVPADRRVLVMLAQPPAHYRSSDSYGASADYGDPSGGARRRRAAAIARRHHLTLVEAWPMAILGIDCFVMAAPGDEPLAAIAARLSAEPGVAWSQPMNRFRAQGATVSGDRLYAAQPAATKWDLAGLHRLATGRGVKVAVIDSLIDAKHPDLRGQVAVVRDFVGDRPAAPETHGTAVAGIVAAIAGNGIGIAGVAPDARLMGLRACRQQDAATTTCDSLSLARALVFALENGAGVVNMSLTGPEDPLIDRLVTLGLRRGVSVVAAVDPATGTGFPASVAGVTAVGSDGLAPLRAHIYTAPGRDVPTTEPGGRWDLVNGNSFAAAHVSGLLALARQIDGRHAAPALVARHDDGGTILACDTLVRAAPSDRGRCDARR